MSLFLKNRHLGMDIVRAFAVLTVLIGHALIFFPAYFKVTWLMYFAVFGVELFFALSGFLIGTILIKVSQHNFTLKKLINFWIKRWMRTIPVYLFIVLLIIIFNQKLYFSYFLFIQNFYPDQLQDFPVSWSLTIEEWFYVSFPLLMYIINGIGKLIKASLQKIIIPLSIVIFIGVPLLLRFLEIDNNLNWDNNIRKQIHLRLDGIAYGVLLAYFYNLNQGWFHHRQRTKTLGLLVAFGFMLIWWFYNQNINIFKAKSSVLNNIVFYPIINIYCMLFVAFFLRFKNYSTQVIQKIILFLSLTSYSLYLIHFPIYLWFYQKSESALGAIFYLILAILCLLILGTILYKTIEKPFIDLRNKWMVKKSTPVL